MLLQQRVRVGKLEKVRFADPPVGRTLTHGALYDVTDGLFHLGRTFVGALLVVVVVVDEI